MILVVGVAGSGKSTQSQLLAEVKKWKWISMGQLLRESLSGELANEMNSGNLLDDEKVEGILYAELKKLGNNQKIILDGFPRRASQADWLVSTANELCDGIEAVIHLTAESSVVLERLLNRGRQDDKPEAINKRFLEYELDIKPLLEALRQDGIPVIDVNGEDNPNTVHENICESLKKVGL
jgi:adenylate kinase